MILFKCDRCGKEIRNIHYIKDKINKKENLCRKCKERKKLDKKFVKVYHKG